MAALPQGSLVLVTGANGYIASHVVNQLLQAGFNVRGTVREAEKADWLREYVAEKYEARRLEIAVVPDMGVEGSFDKAVKGENSMLMTEENSY
jgi:nucleoside-diphosphate-sugar epimerase